MKFIITGRMREKETRRPLRQFLVRAYDQDRFSSDDVLGNAVTDSNGKFKITFTEEAFQDLFTPEKRPDIYLVVYAPVAATARASHSYNPIYSTKRNVLRSAFQYESFDLLIERRLVSGITGVIKPVRPDSRDDWRKKMAIYFKENPNKYRPDKDKGIALPQLNCTSNFGPQIRDAGIGEETTVTVKLMNEGTGPSFFTYVQIYEGPRGYNSPVSDYRLCDEKIVSIQPGQTRDVDLLFWREKTSARIVGICFDPMLDRRDFALVEQYNRHITSVHYNY